MAQGIEDGYLAACEILKGRVNLDDTGITHRRHHGPQTRWTPSPASRSPRERVAASCYDATSFEDRILLPDRVQAMCQRPVRLPAGDRRARAEDHHLLRPRPPRRRRGRRAEQPLRRLVRRATASRALEPYAFKCTAASSGNDQLPDLRGASRSHFIATTVDLLTTGVDVPCVRNIVFFKYVRSPIAFYQMVGRGTRIDAPTGKLMFRVYDYTDATRLFGEEFITQPPRDRRRRPRAADRHRRQSRRSASRASTCTSPTPGASSSPRWTARRCRCRSRSTRSAWPRGWWRRPPRWTTSASAGSTRRRGRSCSTRCSTSGYSPTWCAWWTSMDDYDLYDVLAELG